MVAPSHISSHWIHCRHPWYWQLPNPKELAQNFYAPLVVWWLKQNAHPSTHTLRLDTSCQQLKFTYWVQGLGFSNCMKSFLGPGDLCCCTWLWVQTTAADIKFCDTSGPWFWVNQQASLVQKFQGFQLLEERFAKPLWLYCGTYKVSAHQCHHQTRGRGPGVWWDGCLLANTSYFFFSHHWSNEATTGALTPQQANYNRFWELFYRPLTH
jgi:hypothetical protein